MMRIFRTACCTVVLVLFGDPVLGHDIYEELTKNSRCACGPERLCEPVEAVPIDGSRYYLPKTGETISTMFAEASPDGRFHRCTYPLNMVWHGRYGVPAYPGAQYENNGRMLETEGPEGWVAVPNNRTKDGSPATRCFFVPRAIM